MTLNLLYRSYFRVVFLSIALLVLRFDTYAQQKSSYTLLWEITGKGLTKPSYLFGTINLRDSRTYHFSDSVYIAIANSSAFALETHPDSTVKDNINNPPTKTDNQEEPPKMETGKSDKKVFASAYLYGLARTFKKKIYGLEPINASTTTSDSDSDEMDEEDQDQQQEALESLIAIYAKGNLENIWAEVQQYYTGDNLADRTKVITNELINLLKTETLFAPIGIALLPGEDGIIALLKKSGYQLRPVTGTFTDLSKNYQIDHTKMDWYKYKDDLYHYSINFPSTPVALPSTGRASMRTYIDPTNNVTYTATALYTGPLTKMTSAQYADTVISNYIKNSKSTLLALNYYDKFGTKLVEAELQTNGNYSRSRLIHVNGTFYTYTIECAENMIHEKFADLFFDSFEVSNPTIISASNWVSYQHENGAFSIKFPVTPEEIKKEVPNALLPSSPYILNMLSATDKAGMVNYLFRYNDFPTGMYLSDKSAVFNALLKEFERKGQIATKPIVIYKNGYEGRAVSVIIEGTYMELEIYLKGNRTYLLLRQNLSGPVKPKNDQFLESFSLLPNLPNKGTSFTLGNIELTMPEIPIQVVKSKEDLESEKKGKSFLKDEQIFFAVNRNSGGVYGIERSVLSKYYRHKDVDSLYGIFIASLSKNSSTPVVIKDINVGNLKVKELITTDSLAGTFKKARIWFQGDSFYSQSLISSKEEIDGAQGNAYFASLTSKKNDQPLFDFGSSKAKLIVEDLASNNSETHQMALGALSFYTFERNELPEIYTALQQKYTDDTTSTGTRTLLINELENLNDEQTPAFLKKLYEDNKGVDLVQASILSTLPYVDKKSYDWYFKTLAEAPTFKIKNYWGLFSPLSDSLAYAAANIDQMIKFMQEETYRPMVLDIFSKMLNISNKASYQGLLESKKDYIGKNALKDLEEDIVRINTAVYTKTVSEYLVILPKLGLNPLTDTFTQKVIALDSVPYLQTSAVAARITANLPIDQQLLAAQLDSLRSRYAIMYALDKAGKITSIPLKYRKHEEFAKLLLYDYLGEEYDYPQEIKLLGSVKEGEEIYYAFDCSYVEEGERKTYLGITGPFNNKADQLNFDSYTSYSNFELSTKDWIKQAKLLIKALKTDE